jgi:hypothetical protein
VAERRPRSPGIRSVVAAAGPRAGEPVERVEAGDAIRIAGTSFGEDPTAVAVLFDETAVRPWASRFSPRELTVTAPLGATEQLRVQVGERRSRPVPLVVRRPKRPAGEAGEPTRELFGVLDEYAGSTSALARALAPYVDTRGALDAAADGIDDGRKVMRRSLELWLSWVPLQAEMTFEPLRTVELMDELVLTGGYAERARALVGLTYGPGGAVARAFGTTLGSAGFAPAVGELLASTSASSILGGIGFFLHEGAKVAEGIEDWLNSVPISAAAGVAAGAAGIADVQINLGNPLSAVAKLVDTVAQILVRIGEKGEQAAQEERLRKLEEAIGRIEQTVGTISGQIVQLLDTGAKLEGKADRAEAKADASTQAVDAVRATVDQILSRTSELRFVVDVLEGKADLVHGEVHRIEGKLDGAVLRLDALEAKGDRLEGKTDTIEAKADRLESKADRQAQTLEDLVRRGEQLELKTDRLEGKADRVEGKQDRLEGKADLIQARVEEVIRGVFELEAKADRLEGKSDRLESKADLAETKLDRLELKADRAEGKADRHEGKLDRLELKADRAEGKLDRHEAKLDSLVPRPPLEGSIADQRGTRRRVSAAVTALDPAGQVHLRAAIDRRRNQLDEVARWTPWSPFGAPAGPALLGVSVDLQYQEGSDTLIDGLLFVRNGAGDVFHRVYRGGDHAGLADAAQWSPWLTFLGQP